MREGQQIAACQAARAVRGPRIHQLAAFLKQIGAPVCSLDFVSYDVRQRRLAQKIRKLVASEHQSLKLERKPCVVIPNFILRATIRNAIPDKGIPCFKPGKT
jgi:hypothetical protein